MKKAIKLHLFFILSVVIVSFAVVLTINPSIEDIDVEDRINCTNESRNAEACIEIYQPVCGWNDPEKIQCIKFPCANTYSNSCFACMDENVIYYTEGECPS